jgi:hypothetical protein
MSCNNQESEPLREGMWLAQLEVMDKELLPFNFNLKKIESGYIIDVYNAGETVRVDEIEIHNDSIKIKILNVLAIILAANFASSVLNQFINPPNQLFITLVNI